MPGPFVTASMVSKWGPANPAAAAGALGGPPVGPPGPGVVPHVQGVPIWPKTIAAGSPFLVLASQDAATVSGPVTASATVGSSMGPFTGTSDSARFQAGPGGNDKPSQMKVSSAGAASPKPKLPPLATAPLSRSAIYATVAAGLSAGIAVGMGAATTIGASQPSSEDE